MADINAAEIITQGAAAAGFAKILVDLVKASPIPAASAALPVLALLFSEGCAFLLFGASGGAFTSANIMLTSLVGIAATAGAIGGTMLQNKVNQP